LVTKGEKMKFAKYLVTLVFAFCAFTSITNAQNVQFLGGGSSALFQELGQGAFNIVNATPGQGCLWTSGATTTNPPGAGTDYFAARDARAGIANNGDENGKLFIAWNTNGGTCAAPTAGYSIYAYMQLDSAIGDRCFFENDGSGHTGCLLIAILNGAVGANQISTQADVPAAAQLPAVIATALTAGATAGHFFVAGTDVRPEDALFATQRALAPCNQLILRQFFNNTSYAVFGGGYQLANPNVGAQIAGDPAYGGGTFNVVNFNITGSDPISGAAVPAAYSVSTVGAQPILIIVGPNTDGAVAQMADITGYTLSQYYAGNLGRTTDLFGVTVAEAMNFLVREPLSGTYNTFEYSNPQSTQFHTGQETSNCNGSGTVLQNPMHLATAPGVFGGAVNRIRSIGTGNIYKFVDAAPNGTPVLGYAFWSAGNVANLTQTRYLKVNGIDPLLPAGQYTGLVPGSKETGAPPIANVNFAGLNAGDYSIWSPLRLVGPPSNAGVAAMITALGNLNVLQNDFIHPANLAIWHSHFQINGQPANAANGPTFCAGGVAEGGGDAGGSTMLGINDTHFCADFGTAVGKLNLTF
jgi:hypothetical protein